MPSKPQKSLGTWYGRNKENPETRIYRLWNNARQRALQKDLPFSITLDWVRERTEGGACEATKIPFDLSVGSGRGRGNPFSPSLDQRVPGLGYTEENTAVVCWMYNCAKGVGTRDDVLKMAHHLVLQSPQEAGPPVLDLPIH